MVKFYKWGFLLNLILFFNITGQAQLTNADSTLFNSVFTSQIYINYWNFPYPWYVYDSVTSMQNLQNRFNNTFPFTPADFNQNTYKNIECAPITPVSTVNASFNALPWIYNQTNPVMKMPFTLNGKFDTTYTGYTPSVAAGNCKTAFLLVHGNGNNTTSMLMQGVGYASIYCNVKNTCLQYGDVYSYCKPNEDWRAIYWNRKKLNDYVYNYCEATGHHYGTNYLIETIALVKSLRSSYSKVVIMGISEGGYTVLLNLLNAEPDGAVISGGYSINFDTYTPSQFVLSGRFGNAPQNYTRDTIKNKFHQTQTNTLFTWGQSDDVALMDPEHDYHYTENFLNSYGNCSFFYDFNYHTFPPCATLDTFIQRIIAKPKAFIVPLENGCNSDSVQIKIGICGQPPFHFDIYKDNNFFATVNTMNDTVLYSLFDEGNYQIRNMDDASVYEGFKSNIYNFKKDSTIGFSITDKHYNCDSNYTEIQLQLSGTSPWYLSSTLNNIAHEDTFVNNAVMKKYNNADLNYLNLTDSKHCSLAINQSVSINDSLLDIVMATPVFDCDSNKTKIAVTFEGRSPWQLKYKKNGIPDSLTIASSAIDLYFENGLYEFIDVTDSNLCQKNISLIYSFSFDSLDFSVNTPAYICDSNKTFVTFSMQGNPPFTINYTKDGTPQTINTNGNNYTSYFESGNYAFQNVTDATGCMKNINQSYNFPYNAINYNMSVPQYDCDSNKTRIHFDFQGNPPWTIDYTKDGTLLHITTNLPAIDAYYANGIYQFIKVTDATNCTKNINQSYVFNKDSIDIQLSVPVYNCDSNKTFIAFSMQGNAPFTINYTKDGIQQFINTNNNTYTSYFENGSYAFQNATDATGCLKNINQNYNFLYNAINYSMSVPQYNCDSNKTHIHFDLQGNAPWVIDYTKDGVPFQITTNSASVDGYYTNGIYQFIKVTDATNCTKNINQSYAFSKDSINMQLSVPVYNCDSNKTLMSFSIQGNPPFIIHYTKDGTPLLINTNNNTYTSYFENGSYVFHNVTDATGCLKNINQNYNFSYNAINYNMSAPQYDCDSNKTHIHFDLQGNAPWVIDYTKDGVPFQITTNSASVDGYYTNGIYQFIKVTDVTNCTKNINQAFSFNYNPINAVITQQQYDCDSYKYKIDLLLQGNSPWTVEYNNGVQFYSYITLSPDPSLFLENGNWIISKIIDATNCEYPLNYSLNVNYNPISVASSVPVYDCDSNKTKVNFSLTGNAPWNINYTAQTVPPANYSIQTYNPNFTLYFTNGSYLITQITDSTSCVVDLYQTVNNFYSPLSYQKNPEVYNCDSNKMLISYSFSGDAPYTLSYKNNITGFITQLNTLLPNISFYLADGNYTVLSVQDIKCTKAINDTISIYFPKLNSNLLPAVVSCDSNKVYVEFSTPQGNKPFTYYYYYNNLYTSFTTYDNFSTLYLNNGQYFFEKVTDSIGCSVNYNQIVNANYIPYQYNGFNQKYLCEKDSTELTLNVSNFITVYVVYTFNGGSIDSFMIEPNGNKKFTLPNGQYALLYISDSIGCTHDIYDTILINNEPVDVSYTSALNCAKRLYTYQFDLKGMAPWTLSYNYLNKPHTETIYTTPFYWDVNAGEYFLASVVDSNGCRYEINQSDTLKAFLNDYPLLYYKDYTLHTIQTPHKYYWYKDEVLIDSVSKENIPSYGNGIYKVLIVDDLGCSNWSNELTLGYPMNINVFPNPVLSIANIVVNDNYGAFWNYQLYDATGKLVEENEVNIPSRVIDMSTYSGGVYSLIIYYENKSPKQKSVIRLLKQ